jgi:hypothetical protein
MAKDGLVPVGIGVDVTRDHAGGRSFLRISRVCIEMFMAHCSDKNDLPKHFSLRKLLATSGLSVSCAEPYFGICFAPGVELSFRHVTTEKLPRVLLANYSQEVTRYPRQRPVDQRGALRRPPQPNDVISRRRYLRDDRHRKRPSARHVRGSVESTSSASQAHLKKIIADKRCHPACCGVSRDD